MPTDDYRCLSFDVWQRMAVGWPALGDHGRAPNRTAPASLIEHPVEPCRVNGRYELLGLARNILAA